MPKALILTVGAQGEQIIFQLNKTQPEYVGFLATKTKKSENIVNDIVEKYKIPPTKLKISYCEDKPSEIGKLIENFNEIYHWLTKIEKIPSNEILVDPTGGRKWMSSGITMIASFLGLNMIYVDVDYKDGKPDPSTMNIVQLGNAYEQTGFLEEDKADKLFNEYSFSSAIEIYDRLSEKISNTNQVETIKIKKCIAQAYLQWTQFKFQEAYDRLSDAMKKIDQFHILESKRQILENQLSILNILKKNDEMSNNQRRYSYFQLLNDDEFAKNILLFLFSLQNRFAGKNHFEQATIILYRILEFISQYRLAKNGIDSGNISEDVRQKYNDEFKKISKDVFGAESEIKDKIELIEGWILLFCIKDKLVEKDKPGFLKGLKKQIEPSNHLWIIHKNCSVDERGYNEFKQYVEVRLMKIFKNLDKDVKVFEFVKF